MSRQLAWRHRKQALGLCAQCGYRPLNLLSWACDSCAETAREYDRERYGSAPWEPGKPGRRPRMEGGR